MDTCGLTTRCFLSYYSVTGGSLHKRGVTSSILYRYCQPSFPKSGKPNTPWWDGTSTRTRTGGSSRRHPEVPQLTSKNSPPSRQLKRQLQQLVTARHKGVNLDGSAIVLNGLQLNTLFGPSSPGTRPGAARSIRCMVAAMGGTSATAEWCLHCPKCSPALGCQQPVYTYTYPLNEEVGLARSVAAEDLLVDGILDELCSA